MKDDDFNKRFQQRADQFIHLANEQSKDANHGEVSSSFLFAAARYNAYIAAATAQNIEELKSNKEEAIKYFSSQYKEAFIESIEDWIENYDMYIKNSD